ncbi:MAG TPA: RNA 2',3'-cyclic phosphodiesterase [Azospirillaceae bacterium]|nr:RNA 2',3'-cyclic phosphodiesterase [Azospirillaceae bacterium]
MIRLFVGLAFPEAIRDRLSGLAGGVPGARWTDPHNLHLTLRFIGEVDAGRVEDIDEALAAVQAPAFTLVLDGVGQFGRGKARMLWAGVERTEALNHLQAKVESAVVRAGIPAEERKFTPHVSLARLKDAPMPRVARFLEDRGLFRAGPILIDRFVLFRSHLGHNGPHYEMLREYPLE